MVSTSPSATSFSATAALVLAGIGLIAVSVVGLLVPGSIFAYPNSIAAGEPMLVIYSFARGWLFLAVTLLLLCACFVVGLRPLAGVKERSAFTVAVAVAVALGAVYIGI